MTKIVSAPGCGESYSCPARSGRCVSGAL